MKPGIHVNTIVEEEQGAVFTIQHKNDTTSRLSVYLTKDEASGDYRLKIVAQNLPAALDIELVHGPRTISRAGIKANRTGAIIHTVSRPKAE